MHYGTSMALLQVPHPTTMMLLRWLWPVLSHVGLIDLVFVLKRQSSLMASAVQGSIPQEYVQEHAALCMQGIEDMLVACAHTSMFVVLCVCVCVRGGGGGVIGMGGEKHRRSNVFLLRGVACGLRAMVVGKTVYTHMLVPPSLHTQLHAHHTTHRPPPLHPTPPTHTQHHHTPYGATDN